MEMQKQNDFSQLLLSKDSGDIQRMFEANYVNAKFKEYISQGVSVSDITTFFHKAQLSGANPVLDQIYLIPRKTRDRVVGTIVFGYNFLLLKAQASKQIQGLRSEMGMYEYIKVTHLSATLEKALGCKSIVVRDGHEYSYIAFFDEYKQTMKDYKSGLETLSGQWKAKPYLMLEKCAVAGVLRRAFPDYIGDMYSDAELGAYDKDESDVIVMEEKEKTEKIAESVDRAKEMVAQTFNTEDQGRIDAQVDAIKSMISSIVGAGADPKEKIKALHDLTGASKMSDLKSKTLSELTVIINKLDLIIKENELRQIEKVKKTAADVSFKI